LILTQISEVILIIALLFLVFFVLGFLMIYIIRPIHDRIWGYKIKRKVTPHSLFFEGAWLHFLIYWFALIIALTLVGVYIVVTSLISLNILGIIGGLLITIFFGFKAFFMFEHHERAKKRHNKKNKK